MSDINTQTVLYCVIGDPVAHSLSPVMHNRALSHEGQNGVYLAFRIGDPAAAVAAVRTLEIQGVSVTIPHKIAIMAHLDAVDDLAVRIGAVNTVVRRQGRLVGYNTDGMGACDALADTVGLDGCRVALLGAGGAARAIGFTLVQRGAQVTVLNRTLERGENLARDIGAAFLPLDRLSQAECQALINTTPVGMSPDTEAMPIDADHLDPAMTVMDIVYNPRETLLLKTARRLGCRTVDGVAMFVNQGAAQFELWTGRKAPVEVMRETVLEALTGKTRT